MTASGSSTHGGRPSSCFKRLFPTHFAFFIFISYVVLSINLGVLVTNSQQKNFSYSYNVTTVVLLVELIKLLAAVGFYLTSGSLSSLMDDFYQYRKVLLLYMVPGGLYCLYNNLAFVNLSIFDPTTYFLLMQLRVLVTGVFYQVLFKKPLSRVQWASLAVLTVGCIVKQLDVSAKQMELPAAAPGLDNDSVQSRSLLEQPAASSWGMGFNVSLLMVQILCSCLAGVFNERLLKGHSGSVSILLQNVFMYLDSSLCNLAVVLMSGDLAQAFSADALSKIVQVPSVLVVVLNNAALGLVTSVFLKNLNSILKVFASAIEPVALAAICFILFGHSITLYTVLSIALVTTATVIYATNPVALVTQEQDTTDTNNQRHSSPAAKKLEEV